MRVWFVSKAFSATPAIIPLLKHTKLGLVSNTMDVSLLLIVPVWQGKLFVFCVKNILDDPPLALHRLGLRGTTKSRGKSNATYMYAKGYAD